ncbi:DUF58 domain-containing protein, partial [Actinospica sp.]|uniref:DUF58 domain-containing protein n=1 Tax=Actinospica sp. TaxID=1872142 RepID=UPI002C860E9E
MLTGRAGLAAGIGSVVVAATSGLLHVPGLLCVGAFEAVLGTGIALDLAQCGRPQDLEFVRQGDTTARLGTQAHVSMLIRNNGRRHLRGVLRDAWPPSAGNTSPPNGSGSGATFGTAAASGTAANTTSGTAENSASGTSASTASATAETSASGTTSAGTTSTTAENSASGSAASSAASATAANSSSGTAADSSSASASGSASTSGSAPARPDQLPLEPRHELDLAPGATHRIDTTLTPTRRGDRKPDLVTVRSIGPFGLAGRQVSQEVRWRLRVLPPFHSRKHLPSRLMQLRETDGRTPVLVRGQGSEFDSLREYVIGDDVRSIDWRATARRNDVVVRTWRPERDRHVVIVLDTSRTSAGRVGNEPKLDSAMDAALLLTAVATRAGDRVDLLAYADDLRSAVRGALPGRTLAVFSDAMAVLEP